MLRKYRPCLAVSLYHLSTDVWRIPLYLREILGECDFRLRRHSRTIRTRSLMSTRLTEPIAAKRQPLRHPCAKRTFDVDHIFCRAGCAIPVDGSSRVCSSRDFAWPALLPPTKDWARPAAFLGAEVPDDGRQSEHLRRETSRFERSAHYPVWCSLAPHEA